jgi:urea transport system substrate-binding protein
MQGTSLMLETSKAVATRPNARWWLSAAAGLAFAATGAMHAAKAEDTIKVGILHSLSGTMAISETTLKDVMLMLIEEQNKKGGLLGKKLEAVVVDPASNWPLFAEKARELISKDKVAAVFGCWTSVSRKSVLPVFKELNSILFYPVQYEGEESERNVFYTGAAPNQQAIPAVDYLMSKDGGSVKRWVLAGTDYVYPRTTNKILEAYLKSKGVKDEDIMINYTPFGHSDWQTIVADIKKFGSAGKKTAVTPTFRSTRSWATRASRPPTSRWWRSRSARRNSPVSTPSRWSATWPPGTTSSRSRTRAMPSSSRSGMPSPRSRTAPRTTRWRPTTSASTCG